MSTNKTANYALHSWEPSDEFHLNEINENFSALDSAVKAEAEALSAKLTDKASNAELAALREVVDTKAAATTITELSQQTTGKLSTLETALSENNAELTALKNTVATKADTSALNSLANTVSSKANSSTLNSLANTVSTKADTSALNTLKNTVNGKADSSALNNLSATVTALQSTVNGKADLSALNTVQAGVPRFVFGQYSGTGNDISQTISLGLNPQVVLVMNARGARYSTNFLSAYSGMAFWGYDTEGGALKVHAGGFTVNQGGGTYLNETANNYFYLVWY